MISGAKCRRVGQVRGGETFTKYREDLMIDPRLAVRQGYREGVCPLNGSCWNMDCLLFLESPLSARCLRVVKSTSASNVHICQKASSSCTYPRQMDEQWFLLESLVHSHSCEQYATMWTDGTDECRRLPTRSPLKPEANHQRQRGLWILEPHRCDSRFSFSSGCPASGTEIF